MQKDHPAARTSRALMTLLLSLAIAQGALAQDAPTRDAPTRDAPIPEAMTPGVAAPADIAPLIPAASLPATQLDNASAQAAARSYDSARAAIAQGHPDKALATIEHGLQQAPDDVRLQFQRGVILARLDRQDEAIAAFVALTQRFPELPEPYNNLATLYARRGELDRASAALHEALRALPGYSLAHENLGDLQLRLAERSYRLAIQADAGNTSARERLTRLQALITQLPATR